MNAILNKKWRVTTWLKIIRQLLTDGYSPFDIFILAPSLKSIKSPARLLENYLKTHESSIPIYVPTSDDEKIDSTVIKDKLIFSTSSCHDKPNLSWTQAYLGLQSYLSSGIITNPPSDNFF